MLTLTFLGASAALPGRGNGNTSFVVQDGERAILVESGPAVLDLLQVAGIDPARIQYLYISHIHGDHTLGFPMLIIHRYLTAGCPPLTVICPAGVDEALRQLVALVYPEAYRDLGRYGTFLTCPPATEHAFQLSPDLRLATMPTVHSVPTLALRMDYAAGAIVYSADAAPTPGLARFAAHCTVLVHDATYSVSLDGQVSTAQHATVRAAAEIAQAAGARILVLAHRSPAHQGREHLLQQEATAVFSGQVLAPTGPTRLVLD